MCIIQQSIGAPESRQLNFPDLEVVTKELMLYLDGKGHDITVKTKLTKKVSPDITLKTEVRYKA